MRMLPRGVLAAGFTLCFAAAADAQSRPAVIELFTSEGCSSCPPAEAVLGEFARRENVLALAFHVDYWDDLGWQDRFGIPDAAARQSAYSRVLGRSTIYTPQVIVDGRSEFLGSDRGRIDGAVSGVRAGVPISVAIIGGEVRVELGAGRNQVPSDVSLVTYLDRAVSAIGRGENSGRTLQEFNIVRSIQPLGHWNGTAESFRRPVSSLPTDATGIAVLVQGTGQTQIIGAATGELRQSTR